MTHDTKQMTRDTMTHGTKRCSTRYFLLLLTSFRFCVHSQFPGSPGHGSSAVDNDDIAVCGLLFDIIIKSMSLKLIESGELHAGENVSASCTGHVDIVDFSLTALSIMLISFFLSVRVYSSSCDLCLSRTTDPQDRSNWFSSSFVLLLKKLTSFLTSHLHERFLAEAENATMGMV